MRTNRKNAIAVLQTHHISYHNTLQARIVTNIMAVANIYNVAIELKRVVKDGGLSLYFMIIEYYQWL